MSESPAEGLLVSSDLLLEAARPDLYRLNAFRVTGLSVDAAPREVARQAERLKLLERLGGAMEKFMGPLPLDPPPDGEAVREALQRLHDPERRLVDELFWFWPQQAGAWQQDEAMRRLEEGDVQGAATTWIQRERKESVAYVSTHNLAVLSHVTALDMELRASGGKLSEEGARQCDAYWQHTYGRWELLLEREEFWSRLTARIRELDDPRLTTGVARRMRASLPRALLMINAQLAVRAAERGDEAEAKRHVEIMQKWGERAAESARKPGALEPRPCPACGRMAKPDVVSGALWCSWCGKEVGSQEGAVGSPPAGALAPIVDEALRRAVASLRERIETMCKAAEPEADADPEHADKVTRRLLKQAGAVLAVVDRVLPPGNLIREAMHDEVALKALACQIPFANKTNQWKESLALLKMIQPLAASETARARIDDNIRTVKGNIEYDDLYGRCWFCSKNRATDKAEVEIKLCGEVRRTPFYEYGRFGERIQWRTATLKIPRCAGCKEVHGKKNSAMGLGGGIGFVLGMGSCIAGASNDNGGMVLLGIFLFFAGLAIGALVSKRLTPEGVHDEAYKNEFTRVKELIKQGWTVGEKPPGVT